MNQDRQNSPQRLLPGLGVFLAISGISVAVVLGVLPVFPANSRSFAIAIAVLAALVGVIVFFVGRSRERERTTIVPALISLLCAFLLTGGSVVGFLATCHWEGQQDPANTMFGWLVLTGAGASVLALLWVIAAAIVSAFRKDRPEERNESGKAPR